MSDPYNHPESGFTKPFKVSTAIRFIVFAVMTAVLIGLWLLLENEGYGWVFSFGGLVAAIWICCGWVWRIGS